MAMSAEERSRNLLSGTICVETVAEQIRQAEQEARKAALEEAAAFVETHGVGHSSMPPYSVIVRDEKRATRDLVSMGYAKALRALKAIL